MNLLFDLVPLYAVPLAGMLNMPRKHNKGGEMSSIAGLKSPGNPQEVRFSTVWTARRFPCAFESVIKHFKSLVPARLVSIRLTRDASNYYIIDTPEPGWAGGSSRASPLRLRSGKEEVHEYTKRC